MKRLKRKERQDVVEVATTLSKIRLLDSHGKEIRSTDKATGTKVKPGEAKMRFFN